MARFHESRILGIAINYAITHLVMKKCKMVSMFTWPDVNTWEVGRTRNKRRKPRREAEWFPAYRQ